MKHSRYVVTNGILFASMALVQNVTAADCEPAKISWGSNNACSLVSTFIPDGGIRDYMSQPRRENEKLVGVGAARYKCEVGVLIKVSASCDESIDAYAATRANTLPTPQNVALPKVGSDADLAPYKTSAVTKASTVTQLTNEVGAWESQMSKDMKAQEARMVAYTDTKHSESRSYTDTKNTEAKSYTDTKSSQTLDSANSYTNTKSSETLTSANNYANTRANQALASANSYTDTKSSQTLSSANSYTDSKANQTLASANTYTDNKATATLNSANSYTNTQSSQTLNSANAYTDSKSTATLNSANTYTNNTNSTTLANSKTYTDSKSASTLTAANNYTDQAVANIQQSGGGTTTDPNRAWTLSFVGQTGTFNEGYKSSGFCSTRNLSFQFNDNGSLRIFSGGLTYREIPAPVGTNSISLSIACTGGAGGTSSPAQVLYPIADPQGQLTGFQVRTS
jgi:hypothetical protein